MTAVSLAWNYSFPMIIGKNVFLDEILEKATIKLKPNFLKFWSISFNVAYSKNWDEVRISTEWLSGNEQFVAFRNKTSFTLMKIFSTLCFYIFSVSRFCAKVVKLLNKSCERINPVCLCWA